MDTLHAAMLSESLGRTPRPDEDTDELMVEAIHRIYHAVHALGWERPCRAVNRA